MNNTLTDAYRYITTTNKEYTRNRDRWEFLYNSFVGGETYRDAAYLTRYKLETNAEYQQRLRETPLDNECQSVIQVYTSFLFRECPERDYGTMSGRSDVEAFCQDADMDGRDLDAFMKDAHTWASVFGHTWILMTKPAIGAATLGAEQQMGVRPYVNLLTPLAVMDWTWERQPNGAYQLSYIKYIEEVVDKVTIIKEWTKDVIKTWTARDDAKEASLTAEEVNELGLIPAITVYNKRSAIRGLGVSDINDIADLQRRIYNYNSEIEQAIRLDGHPSLVVTPDTQYGSGAGAVIVVPENSDPGLRPYYLEHGGANISSIHDSIRLIKDTIDKLSNTGSIRATETRTLSGVAMEVEFSLLNARLSEKADQMELAEEQLWNLFAAYQGTVWDGEVEYPGSFNVRDLQREFQQLQVAKSAATSPEAIAVIDFRLRELLEDPRLPNSEEAMTTPADLGANNV